MSHTIVNTDTPLAGFSDSHRGIVCGLRAFASLPELAAAATRSRAVAADTLALFDDAVLPHHADEENELFPAVLRSAEPGSERGQVQAMVDRLVAEHRSVEALWKQLKPQVKRAAAATAAALDADAVEALVIAYNRHAAYEELEFLPLAATILGRNDNHLAALGMSLHMRHAPHSVPYI